MANVMQRKELNTSEMYALVEEFKAQEGSVDERWEKVKKSFLQFDPKALDENFKQWVLEQTGVAKKTVPASKDPLK